MTKPAESDQIDVRGALAGGRQTFLGLELLCGEGALVPRPETELLARAAIDKVRDAGPGARVVDMCCGTGNLACAIAAHVPDALVWASDVTDACVTWARRNVAHLGLADRVKVEQGDLFGALAGCGLEGSVDVVACNPPYISSGRLATDRASLLADEPREAFDGGPYGLTIHQRVVKEALPFLKPGGWLLFEFGAGQERQLQILLQRARVYAAVALTADSAGNARVIAARVNE